MKKKFLQIVSAVLAVMMVLPTAVFAADRSIKVGETCELTVEGIEDMGDSNNATINWESSDRGIATVTRKNGDKRDATVTGVAAGEVTITATRVQYGQNGKTETFTIEVTADPSSDTDRLPLDPADPPQTPEQPEIPDEPAAITIVVDGAEKTLYHDGSNNTLQLKVEEDVKVEWSVYEGSEYVSVSSSGLVTAKAPGTATIRAIYYGDKVLYDDYTVTVEGRTLKSFYVVENDYIERHYYVGESFNKKGITAYATYSDAPSNEFEITNYEVYPSVMAADTKEVVFTYTYAGKSLSDKVSVTVDTVAVESVAIVNPANNAEIEKGKALDSVTVKVVYNNGETKEITATKSDAKGVTLNDYTLGSTINADISFTASYGGKTSSSIIVKAKETKEEYTLRITSEPTKKSYTVGQSLDLSGLKFDIYKNGSFYVSKTASDVPNKYTFKDADVGKTTLTLGFKFSGVEIPLTISGFTVSKASNVTELDKSESKYDLVDEDDIEIKVGDKLNDDVKWYDIFEEVRIKVDGSWKTIDSKSDLDNYPGVELLLKVYGKSSDSDIIEAGDIKNDGTVYLQLYIKNGSKTITDTSKSIRVYVPVEEAECTVSIYSSTTSTSSSYLKGSAVFDDLYDALEALQDDSSNDFEDAFGESLQLKSTYAVRIKLGKDMTISKSDVFEPEHHVPVIIDLNGHKLTIYAEKWISYGEDDDFKLTVTNTNTKKDGSLVYKDKSVTLTVANGSKLEFSEDNIPMDADAECTVSIYKNGTSTSSSALIKTKVYETLKEALQALEDLDDAMEEFEIDEDYEDTFVVKMKLGEDQNLSSFNFAPEYDTTVTIDLNGHTVKLKSDWISYYSDCEDLVVKFINTNKDKKATLTYTDMSNASISLASTDSALTFEEGKIPGIYKVEIASVTNGKVTMNPNKDKAAQGSTVTFTITPNEGYEISSVKDGTKTISASSSGYTVSSRGVGTYKKENITADVKLTVTFKKTSTTSSSSSSSSSSAADWNNPFTDISANAQYYEAVAFVCSEGLFNGMTATKFEPTTTMTRAMFVTVLGRLAGINEMLYSGTSFTDVSKSDQQIAWAAPYIEWAVQKGITNGTGNGKFSPNEPITHQQMYLFMQRYAEKLTNVDTSTTGVNLSKITDAGQIADWAEDGVKFASKYGILITSNSRLTPTENALRCELAMLLHGFCVKVLGK